MSAAQSETIRGLVPEDLLLFSWLEEVELSPSGEFVAYTVRRPDAERNGYQAHVYLRNLLTGDEVVITSGIGYGSSLAWNRSGDRLAFNWRDAEGSAIRAVTVEPPRRAPARRARPAG